MDADVLVIGAGPSGLQAAIHAARKKVSVVVVGKINNSAAYGIRLENYFGTGLCSGSDLLNEGVKQALSAGATLLNLNVMSISRQDGLFSVHLEDGSDICARSLVMATGIRRNKLGVPGEKEFSDGKGVSYCAVCDCNFYKDKVVAVTGSESEAASSAELMTKYASKVYWVSPMFEADPSLVRKADAAGVERICASITKISGDKHIGSIVLSDGRSLDVEGLFIELGGRSSADLAMDAGLMPEIDDTLKVNRSCETASPGIFACGDITGRPWQVAKAVGEGAVAGLSAADFIKGNK